MLFFNTVHISYGLKRSFPIANTYFLSQFYIVVDPNPLMNLLQVVR